MTNKKFLPYARQSITTEDIQNVAKALSEEVITRGPLVKTFEESVAVYCNVKYAVAFNSGTSALAAACYAAGMGPHDRFITTPNSFVATVGAGWSLGATPVFVDIDLDTGNLDLEQVQYTLDVASTRGRTFILPVHFSGIPVDMQVLDSLISSPDCVVIEDSAHAIGSRQSTGEMIGSCPWSQMSIFSFHPAKTITTGEGGMVTTNDEDLYHKLSLFRNNGIERDPRFLEGFPAPWHYEVSGITGNFNFTEMQAALGISQLKKIDQYIEKRKALVKAYRARLQNMPHLKLFNEKFDDNTAYHLFVAQIDFSAFKTTRLEVVTQLFEKGIGTQVHYIPIYRHPFFKEKSGDISSYFPKMETYYQQALTLPLYYDLSLEEVDRICEELKAVLRK
jgi:UDP-4-amino-4,6-dideoxy-L-N-acetyl-beta-L-altrosamine transaminase